MAEDQIQFPEPVEHEAPPAADHHEAPAEPQVPQDIDGQLPRQPQPLDGEFEVNHLHDNVACICLKSFLFVLFM